MKLSKSEETDIDILIYQVDILMKEVWKRKKNKRLYVSLGQARMALECSKKGAIIEKFLVAKSW